MNLYLIGMPGSLRFVEAYNNGDWDDSWCDLPKNAQIVEGQSLFAKRKQRFDVYWFITGEGFEMALTEKALNLLFHGEDHNIELTRLFITRRRREVLDVPEPVFHIKWLGPRLNVDMQKLESIKDIEIPVGGDMTFVRNPEDFKGQIMPLDYFHNFYVVSEQLKDKIIDAQLQQVSLTHIERVPMDAGNLEVKSKNNINRLMEQGLSYEAAVQHIKMYRDGMGSGTSIKEWSNGQYVS